MHIGSFVQPQHKIHLVRLPEPRKKAVSRASTRDDASHICRPRTLYGVLGIKRSASLTEIRTAYRNAARRLHPDTNASPAAQEDFQRIKAAYEVLGDSQLRKVYDNLGLGALGPKFSDLLIYLEGSLTEDAGADSGVPGGDGRQGRVGSGVRGRDVHLVLGLMLSEAAQGTDKTLMYEAMSTCEECQGSGCASTPPACPVCRGNGQVLKSQYVGAAASGQFGGPKVLGLDTCPACAGSGRVSQPPCPSCSGRGRRLSSRELAVRIPAGVERGQVLRVAGEGGAGGCGGSFGDLLVRLEVYPDANLERRGDLDLHSSLAVDVFVAVLGAAVAVDTVRGSRLLDVPPGSQPGDVLRLGGAGIARAAPDGGTIVRGDHYFTLAVRLPSAGELCTSSLELLTRLAAIDSTLPPTRRTSKTVREQSDGNDAQGSGGPAAAVGSPVGL